MKKLAFIDHSFKIKSNSSRFFIEILMNEYDVDIFWDESWMKKPKLDFRTFANKEYDVIILFQMLNYTTEELQSTSCKNIIMIPMYDAILRITDSQWLERREMKFINFSLTLHHKMIKLGLNSKYIQFFPDINDFKSIKTSFNKLNGFFWQRTSQITWRHVRKLIAHADFNSFHIHAAIDPPGYDFIEPADDEKIQYNISISDWFDKREDYLKVTQKANIYFAPRVYEGIGMSFLEAMAQGKCVVAPNNPTMNEYITHGVNGYLYDVKDPRPIDFSNARQVAHNAKEFIKEGYKRWHKQKEELLRFVQEPPGSYRLPGRVYFKMALAELQYRSIKHRIKHRIKEKMKVLFPELTYKLIHFKMRMFGE